jgi:precorrin-3B methylase
MFRKERKKYQSVEGLRVQSQLLVMNISGNNLGAALMSWHMTISLSSFLTPVEVEEVLHQAKRLASRRKACSALTMQALTHRKLQ